jgi:hypothetical protein
VMEHLEHRFRRRECPWRTRWHADTRLMTGAERGEKWNREANRSAGHRDSAGETLGA